VKWIPSPNGCPPYPTWHKNNTSTATAYRGVLANKLKEKVTAAAIYSVNQKKSPLPENLRVDFFGLTL